MKTTTVLVSGSSGYVGSHTAKFLAKEGYRVVGLDEVSPSKAVRAYLADDLVADISSPRVLDFIQKNRVDGVIHCAAKCLVGESVQNPELYHDYNVERSSLFVEQL